MDSVSVAVFCRLVEPNVDTVQAEFVDPVDSTYLNDHMCRYALGRFVVSCVPPLGTDIAMDGPNTVVLDFSMVKRGFGKPRAC